MHRPLSRPFGFTLVELLVVVAVIAILGALLMPAVVSAKRATQKAACLSNLRQVGVAVHTYAEENDGKIPYGPIAPPFTSPSSFYPSTGSPTSLLSLQSGAPVGLGLLLERYLASEPKVLFCPAADQRQDIEAELAKVGRYQAQCSYFYRHGSNTQLFDNPTALTSTASFQLESLGLNRNGLPVRALAIDSQFLCPPGLEAFNVMPRTHHQQKIVNVLFADASVMSRPNLNGKFTVDVRNYAQLRDSFSYILRALEQADAEY